MVDHTSLIGDTSAFDTYTTPGGLFELIVFVYARICVYNNNNNYYDILSVRVFDVWMDVFR